MQNFRKKVSGEESMHGRWHPVGKLTAIYLLGIAEKRESATQQDVGTSVPSATPNEHHPSGWGSFFVMWEIGGIQFIIDYNKYGLKSGCILTNIMQ